MKKDFEWIHVAQAGSPFSNLFSVSAPHNPRELMWYFRPLWFYVDCSVCLSVLFFLLFVWQNPSPPSCPLRWPSCFFPSLCKVPSPVVQGPMLISTMTPVILDPNHHSWFLFPIRLWAPWGQMGLLFFSFYSLVTVVAVRAQAGKEFSDMECFRKERVY